VGVATAKILHYFGYEVVYDPRQTCCGQPAFNAGHRDESLAVAAEFVKIFDEAAVVVAPSGSCVAMIRNYYPVLFRNHPLRKAARRLGRCAYELSEFLARENLISKISGSCERTVGFHNSCHSCRELHIHDTPIEILKRLKGIRLVEPPGETECCGFGGLFSFKFDAIASTMGYTRLDAFVEIGVDCIVTNDPGCLMHMRQEAESREMRTRILHIAEFLAGSMNL
jgi:L-lactate dehydrogenase complex protein LldE